MNPQQSITVEERYSKMVLRLAKPPTEIYNSLTPVRVNLLHACLGIVSEAGELADTTKKTCMYNQAIDLDNILEELGDLEFYMELMRQVTGITREATLESNMRKLALRYASGYTDEAAKKRADKEEPMALIPP